MKIFKNKNIFSYKINFIYKFYLYFSKIKRLYILLHINIIYNYITFINLIIMMKKYYIICYYCST